MHAVATGFVDFATRNAALLDLMFAVRGAQGAPALHEAAERLFSTMGVVGAAGFEPATARV